MNNEVTRKLQEQDFWDESKRKVFVNCSFKNSEKPRIEQFRDKPRKELSNKLNVKVFDKVIFIYINIE